MLLIGAGMFTQSLNKLQNIDLKLDPKNRYIVHINPQAAGYSPPSWNPSIESLKIASTPSPASSNVGIATNTPMEANNSGNGVQIHGQPYWATEPPGSAATPNTSTPSAPTSFWPSLH